MDISDDSSGIDLLESSTATSDALMTLPGSAARVLMPRSTMFFTPPSSSSGLDSYVFGGRATKEAKFQNRPSKRHRWWTQPRTDSTATLKQSYGELLLRSLDDDDQHVTMEDFIVMSCLISACEDIAANLTRLNTLAAS
ncbi:Parvalbumin [Phytophthora cactorum]|nr:Parvalbumin [Phytophthora cactorum]